MENFEIFHIQSFNYDKSENKAYFYYNFDEKVEFCEEIDFNSEGFTLSSKYNEDEFNSILSHLSIALWISYYKAYPTKKIVINSFNIDDYQKEFWNKFYVNGLSEYLYRNQIKPDWLANFESESEFYYQSINFVPSEKALVPIWGGKDSLLSVELVKKAGIDFETFTFGKDYVLHRQVNEVIWKKRLVVNRKISKELFKLNEQWYYNGHVPITWIIALVMKAISYLYNYKYLVLSNEKSANYWNTKWEWLEVNHQWSKSLEFEKMLRDYSSKYISNDVYYFSLLRDFYEIKIAKLVANYKQYFLTFSSCNNNFKIIEKNKTVNDRWCLNCPKCAFVYSILRPYLSEKEVTEIFGKDMFEDENQIQVFEELLWVSGIKPFECVWTNEEVILGMYYSLEKYDNLPPVLAMFKEKVANKMTKEQISELEEKMFKTYGEDIIPTKLKNIINTL